MFEDELEGTQWALDGDTKVRNDNLYQAYCAVEEIEYKTREIFDQLSREQKREAAEVGREMFGGLEKQ